ncbi:UNVERIFIED_CONTAM: Retrovirus-related Pol polyprotein from type-1 retrotransposable element R2 [Sesamum latifolium]|uniref:Retrovirus-related Pol polyprotein from type-1 retrotransposable element R2 n=1 Tax=Sesamum latifolium TaxID=2727402 RepID=A0AAW2XQ65_9LAMI
MVQIFISNPEDIKNSAVDFFCTLLSARATPFTEPEFPFQFACLSTTQVANLCHLPSKEEIKEVVFQICKDSVAGPDGFTSTFYQTCWDFISSDIKEAVKDFFCGSPMPRSFTATTITLIPKTDNPQTWSEFRPISLCNVTNKILSKLLYKKLADNLPMLISPSQSGFVPRKLIGDNILLAQEMIHSLDKRYDKGNVVLKLDMTKAYDKICWKFLYCVLHAMGFPARFIHLIKNAIENCWFTVLINGETASFFKSTQGLRQGDPISPALLILAAEALSRGLGYLFRSNPTMYYQTHCRTPVTHLSYADDIIIFTNSDESNLEKLMDFL